MYLKNIYIINFSFPDSPISESGKLETSRSMDAENRTPSRAPSESSEISVKEDDAEDAFAPPQQDMMDATSPRAPKPTEEAAFTKSGGDFKLCSQEAADLVRDMKKLYKNRLGADFNLVSKDGARFHVHRGVLMTRSTFFGTLLANTSLQVFFKKIV